MQRTQPFKEPSVSSTNIIVGTTNTVKLEAVLSAFTEWRPNNTVIVAPKQTDSKVRSQPIGLAETRLGAVNRMQACSAGIAHTTDQECVIAVGIENGIVTGEELMGAMGGSFSREHWYDVGIVAVRIYQQQCHFDYVAHTVPLQIPNDPSIGMLPPTHPESMEVMLAKYSANIMPLIKRGRDLYEVFSNHTFTREGTLKEACLKAFHHLANIHFLDTKTQRFDKAILFGTFDLFHDLHRKLLDDAAAIANEVIVYVNEDTNKFKRNTVTQQAILDTKNTIIDSPETRRRKVVEYLSLRGVAKLKKGKHLEQLQIAIEEQKRAGKTVVVFGGCDQFENFPNLLSLCYKLNTPIITRSRGETDTLLCTTDLKAKRDYQAIASRWHIDLGSNSRFYKQRINNKQDAVKYLRELTKPKDTSHADDNNVLGLKSAEVWQYLPDNQSAARVVTPYAQPQHIFLTLPGRTRCDVARARKILATVNQDFVPANLKDSIACFIACYQQVDKTTADDLKQLKENPDYFSADAMIFTELLILPRIKEGCMGISLWARSYGTVMAIEIENAFRYKMREQGYSDEHIAAIAKNIHVLSISNLAPLERPRLFTTVSVTGYNDKQAQKYIENFSSMIEKYYRAGESISRTTQSSTHHVVMTEVPERFTELSTGRLIRDPKCHYTPNYFSVRKPDAKQPVVNNAAPDLIRKEVDQMLKGATCGK